MFDRVLNMPLNTNLISVQILKKTNVQCRVRYYNVFYQIKIFKKELDYHSNGYLSASGINTGSQNVFSLLTSALLLSV